MCDENCSDSTITATGAAKEKTLTELKNTIGRGAMPPSFSVMIPRDAYEIAAADPIIDRAPLVTLTVDTRVSLTELVVLHAGVVNNLRMYDRDRDYIVIKDLPVATLRGYNYETTDALATHLVNDGFIRLQSSLQLLRNLITDPLAFQALMLALVHNEVHRMFRDSFPSDTKHEIAYGYAKTRECNTHSTHANWLFGAYLLDYIGITEHGGSVYSSWLDDDHKPLLSIVEWGNIPVLNPLSDVWFVPASGTRVPYGQINRGRCTAPVTDLWDVIYTPNTEKETPELKVLLEPIDAEGSQAYWDLIPADEDFPLNVDEEDSIQDDILHLCCCGNPSTSLGFVAHMLRLFHATKGNVESVDLTEWQTWMGEIRLFAHYGSLIDVGLIDFTTMTITPKGIAVHDRIIQHLLTEKD